MICICSICKKVENGGYRKYMLPVCPPQMVFSSVWSQRSVTAASCWKIVPCCFLVYQTYGTGFTIVNKLSNMDKSNNIVQIMHVLEVGLKCWSIKQEYKNKSITMLLINDTCIYVDIIWTFYCRLCVRKKTLKIVKPKECKSESTYLSQSLSSYTMSVVIITETTLV